MALEAFGRLADPTLFVTLSGLADALRDPMVQTLVIAAAALVLFVTELVPPYVTALATSAALMILGVLETREGLSGFSNDATIAVLSLFIIAAGVQRTGLVNMLAHKVLDWTSHSETKFLVLLIAVTAVISGFVANTPVVAIFMPLAITVAMRMKRSPSKYLMPLSHAAVLGGMLTLIGTSTNILGSSIAEELGYEPFSMFMFTKVGALILVAGAAYLLFVGRYLLPDRSDAASAAGRFGLQQFLAEVVVDVGSRLVGETVRTAHLRSRFDIDVIRIFRDGETYDHPLVDLELRPGDVLLVRASRDDLLHLRESSGLSILPEVTHPLPGEEDPAVLLEVIVAPGASIEGATLAESRFRQRYDAVVLGIRKREWLFLRRLHAMALEPGDTLLLATPRHAVSNLRDSPDFILTQELPAEQWRRERIPVALAILLGVVVAASVGTFDLAVVSLAGAVLMLATGCLRVHELHEAVRIDVVFLLAGLIPLGVALQKTGAAGELAGLIVRVAGDLSPLMLLGLVYLITMLLTEFMSNNASVAMMMPVAVGVAERLSLNPVSFLLAVTFAASLAFMTPMGYQTNLMVYGPGGYKFVDFLKVGGPLNLISMVMSVVLINVWWPVAG